MGFPRKLIDAAIVLHLISRTRGASDRYNKWTVKEFRKELGMAPKNNPTTICQIYDSASRKRRVWRTYTWRIWHYERLSRWITRLERKKFLKIYRRGSGNHFIFKLKSSVEQLLRTKYSNEIKQITAIKLERL